MYIIILLLVIIVIALTTAAGITAIEEKFEGVQDDINKMHEDMKSMEHYLDYQIQHMKEGDHERKDA